MSNLTLKLKDIQVYNLINGEDPFYIAYKVHPEVESLENRKGVNSKNLIPVGRPFLAKNSCRDVSDYKPVLDHFDFYFKHCLAQRTLGRMEDLVMPLNLGISQGTPFQASVNLFEQMKMRKLLQPDGNTHYFCDTQFYLLPQDLDSTD